MLHRVVGSEIMVTIPEKMLDDIHIETVTDDPDLRQELAENRLLHVKRSDRSAFPTGPIHVSGLEGHIFGNYRGVRVRR